MHAQTNKTSTRTLAIRPRDSLVTVLHVELIRAIIHACSERTNVVVENSRNRCATTAFPACFRMHVRLYFRAAPNSAVAVRHYYTYFLDIIRQEARKRESERSNRSRRRNKADILSTSSRTKTVSDRISRRGVASRCAAMSKNTSAVVNLIGIVSRERRLRYRK